MARFRLFGRAARDPDGETRSRRWPALTVDLSRPMHRRNLAFSFAGLAVVALIFMAGGYQGYEFSESSTFCGTLCHPMKPTYIRYQESEHARVACANCHVGPGLEYFMRSKMEGTRQLVQVAANSYERPIKSPLENLRPARETCEQCHNPAGFKDNLVKNNKHYDNDEANTLVQASLILKMGGWQSSTGVSSGIHWHVSSKVYYIAQDDKRQTITWVGVQQSDGTLKQFIARDRLNTPGYAEQARAEGQIRQMDCIDCHNRAAHLIPSPEESVDQAIAAGKISQGLPYIRREGVAALKPAYNSQAEAYGAIDGIAGFYRQQYPNLAAEDQKRLDAALAELKRIYDQTAFPDMNLNWATTPDNEHHTTSPGCFRCHDGNHVQVDAAGNPGAAISAECNLCHTVPLIGRGQTTLVEAPIILGPAPATHNDFRWTISHQGITVEQKAECLNCHGQGFCSNGACHNLSHPPDMLFQHAQEARLRGDQVCDTCHQHVLCNQCHTDGWTSTKK